MGDMLQWSKQERQAQQENLMVFLETMGHSQDHPRVVNRELRPEEVERYTQIYSSLQGLSQASSAKRIQAELSSMGLDDPESSLTNTSFESCADFIRFVTDLKAHKMSH